MIAPISSWAAAVSGCVDSETYSGLELFVRAIPYNFYSLLTIVFIIAPSECTPLLPGNSGGAVRLGKR